MRSIAIQIFDEKNREIAQQCAQNLSLPIVMSGRVDREAVHDSSAGVDLFLCYHEEQWFLRKPVDSGAKQKEALGDLHLDFLSGAVKHRFMQGGGKGQDIAKAIGLGKKIKSKRPLRVLDATAGLGRDAFVLASLGCQVEMCEENSVVHFLLEHAISSGLSKLELQKKQIDDAMESSLEAEQKLYETLKRMSCENINSLEKLKKLSDSAVETEQMTWDVIYLDPMFPERNKSAKVKKEMQYLQLLLHDQQDQTNEALGNLSDKEQLESQLLEAALQANCSRVVVKRPAHAPCLQSSTQPSHAIKGKSTRFDVYAIKAL